jgi:hypothetical protein
MSGGFPLHAGVPYLGTNGLESLEMSFEKVSERRCTEGLLVDPIYRPSIASTAE